MEEIELKGNSFKSREQQEPKVEKVTTGVVKKKSQSTGKQFARKFVNEDANNVKDYVLFDVIVPFLKDMLSSAITTASDMFIYGEVKGRKGSGTVVRSNGRTDYNGISSNRQKATVRDRYVIDDIYFEERIDAEKVLDELCDQIEQYGRVSAYDFYDACGLSCDIALKNWGWFDLNTASVHPSRGEWIIKLPRLQSIR